jgi:hypothetical protein
VTIHHIHINNNLLRVTTLKITGDVRRGAERIYTLQINDLDTLEVHVFRDSSENRIAARVAGARAKIEENKARQAFQEKHQRISHTAKRRHGKPRKKDSKPASIGGLIL